MILVAKILFTMGSALAIFLYMMKVQKSKEAKAERDFQERMKLIDLKYKKENV